MEQTKNILATENIRKLFIKMVIPSVIAQLITLVYNMVDRIFIGHIPEVGSVALTGIGVCMPITLIISSLMSLLFPDTDMSLQFLLPTHEYDFHPDRPLFSVVPAALKIFPDQTPEAFR